VNATPLVAVLFRVPLVAEAVRDALEGIAETRVFPVRDEVNGLLASVRPDVVIVDHDDEAAAALEYVEESDAIAFHVRLRDETLSVVSDGAWTTEAEDVSPETIRNAVAGALFGRVRA
jgi:hypothetical protein